MECYVLKADAYFLPLKQVSHRARGRVGYRRLTGDMGTQKQSF